MSDSMAVCASSRCAGSWSHSSSRRGRGLRGRGQSRGNLRPMSALPEVPARPQPIMRTKEADQLRQLAIVPAYNEEGMVARVVREIGRHAPEFDVVVVDDGSTDRTAAEAEATGATVIRHPFNLGIGGAMQTGFKYALERGYDVAAQVDGDGQHKTEYIEALLSE